MRLTFVVLLLIICGALGYSLYLLYDNLPHEPIKLIINSGEIKEELLQPDVIDKNRSVQFYSNLRFSELPVKYSFDSNCDSKKRESMMEAFEYLEGRTLLEFRESGDADLEITCSELAPEPTIKNHFIAGEGGPVEIINGTKYSIILKAKIALYREEKCESAHISVHELLHALGFDHNNKPKSILYPTLECDQIVDDYLIDELNRLYLIPSLPDLVINEANATKAGRYLSFNVEISNQGLNKAENVKLEIYDENAIVKEFELNDISVGVSKILTVENLKVNRNSEKIIFKVKSSNNELDEDNNEIVFVPSG